MERAALEQRFEAAMGSLVSAHGEAVRYRSSSLEAEPIFLEALGLADDVRRSARHGDLGRPDAGDCSRLETLARTLDDLVRQATCSEVAGELTRAVEQEDHARAADAAVALFSGLERLGDPPPYLYHPLALRERARGKGEVLPAAPVMAGRIADLVEDGLRPEAPASQGSTPGPIVLAWSLESSGAEVALRIATGEIVAPILWHEPTAELWVFAQRLARGLAVSATAQAEDEWWAASPVPYRTYLDALRAEVTRRGMFFSVED